jgi:hypothetical protein
MNRHLRRLERAGRSFIAKRTPGVMDPRVKSSGHRKRTADKWNQ